MLPAPMHVLLCAPYRGPLWVWGVMLPVPAPVLRVLLCVSNVSLYGTRT